MGAMGGENTKKIPSRFMLNVVFLLFCVIKWPKLGDY